MLEDLSIEENSNEEQIKEAVPKPNVDAEILQKVTELREDHKDDMEPEKNRKIDNDTEKTQDDAYELSSWDKDFINSVNSVNDRGQSMIFDLIIAANYLDIPGLHDLTVTEVARMMKCKSQDEMRDLFKLTNDNLVSDGKK